MAGCSGASATRLAANIRMRSKAPHQPSADWVELVVRAWPPDVEAVADALRELSPAGVAIEPAIRTLDHDHFQYELLDAPATLRVCLAGPLTPAARRSLRRRLTGMPLTAPLPRLRYAEVRDQDWAEEWKRFFGVQHVGQRLVVRPSWERYSPRPDEVVIELDPGTAFGTGQHETTRLCLAALETHMRPGAAVIDVGTGSGILAVAAALLGAASVRACDTDPDAVVAAQENVRRNGVSTLVRTKTGSLGPAWPWSAADADASASLVVANISSATLVALMPEIARALRPGGRFVGSGFIEAGQTAVEAAATAAGLRSAGTTADGEWRCLVALKPHAS